MASTKAEINKQLKRTNIKGKDYIDVAQRINGFWELFPEGRITTEWLELTEAWAVCQATVWNMDAIVAQGTAYEVKGASNINKTSYVENCETSAIGRALGIAGIGSTDSIASANEVANAIKQQDAKPAPSMKQQAWQAVQRWAKANGADARTLFEKLRERENFADNDAYWASIMVEFA